MADEKLPEKEGDERFQRTLERLVGSPPKPHKVKDAAKDEPTRRGDRTREGE